MKVDSPHGHAPSCALWQDNETPFIECDCPAADDDEETRAARLDRIDAGEVTS